MDVLEVISIFFRPPNGKEADDPKICGISFLIQSYKVVNFKNWNLVWFHAPTLHGPHGVAREFTFA